MKRYARVFCMLLAIIMIVGLLPLSVIADDIQSTHTVWFKLNYNGAKTLPSVTVADGECVTEPENASRTGWILKGWFTQKNGGEKFDFDTPITGDVTLYAQWTEDISYWGTVWGNNIVNKIEAAEENSRTYTVTFDGNGIDVKNIPEAQEVKNGECAEKTATPTRNGYTFGGWYTEPECITAYDFTSAVKENITLYAKWNANEENPSEPGEGDNLNDGIIDLGDIVDMQTKGKIDVICNKDGSISSVTGKFTDEKVNSAEDAAKVLNSAAPLFGDGFSADEDDINKQSVGDGEDAEYFYRLNAEINGIRVLGSQIILSTDKDGNVTGLFTSYDKNLYEVSTYATVTEDEAKDIAVSELLENEEVAAFIDAISASNTSVSEEDITKAYIDSLNISSELIIYAADSELSPFLVYAVSIDSYTVSDDDDEDDIDTASLDSASGEMNVPIVDYAYYIYANGSSAGTLYKYIDMRISSWSTVSLSATDALDATRSFIGQEQNGTYRLKDTTRNITTYKAKKKSVYLLWYVWELPGTIAKSSSVLWSSEYIDKLAVSTHANMEKTYDYYKNTLGRKSFDGNGAHIKASYNYGDNYKNAYWSDTQQMFVFGSGGDYAAALDVVAHEFTHGVISYAVGTGYDSGLEYSGETGALNEAYADILGSLVEGKSGSAFWEIGEDCGTMRDMSNPARFHQPTNYSALSDSDWSDYLNNFANRDNEGVHVFESVYALAFHNMVTDTRTASITKAEWANVFYRSLFRLTSDATFLDGRGAVIASAKALGFDHDEQEAIKDAFDSVGICEPNSIRIVLTWNDTPADLDSHLVGPGVNGGRFHVYFGQRSYYANGTYNSSSSLYAADLDYDDVTSYGPEVTTIHVFTDGDYYFYVHDYTTYSSETSTVMANSGATVRVYWGSGSTPIATFNIDKSSKGVYWNVFKLTVEDSAVSMIRELNTYGSSPSYT